MDETPLIDLGSLGLPDLLGMAEAARTLLSCRAALAAAGRSILDEIAGEAMSDDHRHYPEGDVYDAGSHAQYYFHRHRGAEHGHFHTFLRSRGMPPGVRPAATPPATILGDNDVLSHLVAIGIDRNGEPDQLFTTNRWVTGETWYRAADVAAMLPRFAIRHGQPSPVANQWVGAVMALFRPQIVRLLADRDSLVEQRRVQGVIPALEDRNLEITSTVRIDIDTHIAALRGVLATVARK